MRIVRVIGALALLIATATAVLGAPTPASAHSDLIGTQPAADSTVTTPLNTVVLAFREKVQGRYCTVVVAGPDGLVYNNGGLRAVQTVISQDVYPLKSGRYRVAWRVVSADGHPISGEFGFTVALPAGQEPSVGPPPNATVPAQPTSADAAAAGSGSSTRTIILVIVVAIVIVAGGLAAYLLRRRARRTP